MRRIAIRRMALRVLAAPCLLTLSAMGAFSALSVAPLHAQSSANDDADKAPPLAAYNFHDDAQNAQWGGLHGIGAVRTTPDGLVVEISGADPYFTGPPLDLPTGVPLWAHLRLYSTQADSVRIFYWNASQDGPSEERVVNAFVTDKGWQNILIPMPALGPGTRFRIDPPGDEGSPPVTLDKLYFTERNKIAAPTWPTPLKISVAANTSLQLRSGALELRHDGINAQGFIVSIDGKEFARGLAPSLIGTEKTRGTEWLALDGVHSYTRVSKLQRGGTTFLREITTARDTDGALWTIIREYSPSSRAGGFDVATRVGVSQPRRVVFLPLLMVTPGAGSFGARKHQALFSGLEYLSNEPSSSTIDITTDEHKRRVPFSYKITMPLMAVQNDANYLALSWEPQSATSALFDSPDRTFKSGGHALGLLMPGSTLTKREDGNPLPYAGVLVQPGEPYVQRAALFGGRGGNVTAAVQEYVARRPLPPLPTNEFTQNAYVNYAARGWLRSGLREGALVRHALYGDFFKPTSAADAAVYMEWLAQQSRDDAQAARLRYAARTTFAQVDADASLYSGISHVVYPLPPLVYGRVLQNAVTAERGAREQLSALDADGNVIYTPAKDKPDYSRGNGSNFSNGLTANTVRRALELAAFSGNKELIAQALKQLSALDKYTGDVPRGAQPWEIALHSPDILASAHLLNCYTLGYELTGDTKMLQRARYWAWTGVPFVYLTHPTQGKVGLYSTLAVLGATDWIGSWFGRPVQWCGLVYSDALRRFAQYDNSGPWMQLADGITITGQQESWPTSDTKRQGLLPDFFLLNPQISDGPAINPGTLQANVVPLYTGARLYGFHAFLKAGLFVHAPGKITADSNSDSTNSANFTVNGWPTETYYVLISGLPHGSTPRVLVNGASVFLNTENYDDEAGRLALPLKGNAQISITR